MAASLVLSRTMNVCHVAGRSRGKACASCRVSFREGERGLLRPLA